MLVTYFSIYITRFLISQYEYANEQYTRGYLSNTEIMRRGKNLGVREFQIYVRKLTANSGN